MRVCQVRHMNEVAFAGSVLGRIVSAKNAQRRLVCGGGIDRERDEVRLRIMPLGEVPIGISAAGIEIAKQRDPQAMRGRGVFEDFVRKRAWSGHRD